MPPQASWTRSHASAPVVPADSATRAAGRGVPHGVGQQVADHAGQLGVAARHRRPAVRARPRPPRRRRPRRPPPRRRRRRRRPRPAPAGRASSRSAADVARESWNRSSTMAASRMVSRRIRARGSRRPRRAGARPRRPARRPCPRIPAIGERRSWLIQPTSSRRAASARRSASRASRCHSASRAKPRPSSAATGTVTAATTTTTARVPASCGVYMKPLTATTPAERGHERDQRQRGHRRGHRPAAHAVQEQAAERGHRQGEQQGRGQGARQLGEHVTRPGRRTCRGRSGSRCPRSWRSAAAASGRPRSSPAAGGRAR